MFDVVKAVNLCANEPRSKFKFGAHARFLDLGDGWGVKYFLNERQRDENYDLQERLSKAELAPEVGVKFNFTRSDREMFGFFTEVVIPYEEYYDDVYTESSNDRIENISDELMDESREHQVYVVDLHEANIGWSDKLDRWVILDCSVCSDNEWNFHRWDRID